MRKLWSAILGSVVILGAGMSASAVAQSSAVKIGVLSPIRTVLGNQAVESAKVAVDMINKKGGVLGHSIELVIYDDGNSPVTSVGAMQRLLDQDNVKIIVGPYGSTQALATLPIARAKNILFLPVSAKHPGVTATGYDKVFRFNSTVAMDDDVLREYLREKIRPASMAFIGENNETSRAYLKGLQSYFPQDPGNRIKFVQYYDSNSSDFSGLITASKAAQVDTIFLAGNNVEQYGNLLRVAKEFKYRPKNLIMAPGIINARSVELAAGGAEGAISTDIYLPSFDSQLNRDYVAHYKTQTKGLIPEKLELLWFEALTVLAQAMEQAGTVTDVDKIAKTMHANAFKSPRGELKFDQSGQALSKPFVVEVKDGKIQKIPQ